MRLIDFLKNHQKKSKFFIHLDEQEWSVVVQALQEDRLTFLMMWCQDDNIYSLFLENGFKPIGITITASMNRYLALSTVRPAAIIYERMIWELWGKEAMQAVDLRPWLDRGLWDQCWPLSQQPGPVSWPPESYEYQLVPNLAERGGEITLLDPSYFTRDLPTLWRFSELGERIIKAESLYGYTHRGILTNLYTKNGLEVLPVISRINALDTIAHQIAYSHAIEDVAGFVPSLSILRKRVLLSELARVSTYLLYLSRLFRVLGVKLIVNRCELARELLMRWQAHHFGNRWLMDCVFPGAVCSSEQNLQPFQLPQRIKGWVSQAKKIQQNLSGLTDSLKNKGILSLDKATQYNIGGFIGRASGRDTDLRRHMSEYRLEWLSPQNFMSGDVYARIQLWFSEIAKSFNMIEMILQEDHEEESSEEPEIIIEKLYGEGIGVCEGVQGDLWYFVKIEAGRIKDIFIRDPAANQAYILQDVLQNTAWEDQPLVRTSFGMLTTGVDF